MLIASSLYRTGNNVMSTVPCDPLHAVLFWRWAMSDPGRGALTCGQLEKGLRMWCWFRTMSCTVLPYLYCTADAVAAGSCCAPYVKVNLTTVATNDFLQRVLRLDQQKQLGSTMAAGTWEVCSMLFFTASAAPVPPASRNSFFRRGPR